MNQFKGDAIRLDAIDIGRLAATIGCGEDHLRAVMEVETRGGGFDTHGRIKMLFEPHVFYRELQGSEREQAIQSGLAYRRWGERKYPRDSYPRLLEARVINEQAALRSCSWSLGQIMGFNHALAGYPTAAAMVRAFRDDEAVHLAAMVEFIISSGLDDDLRREDWRGFARGYNGTGYAKHGYHIKLKAAFAKWQKIPDTPFPGIDRVRVDPNPQDDPILTTRGRVLRSGMQGADVKTLQDLLARLGYFPGGQDGIFGRLTKDAVVQFQSDKGLVADGQVGELTWAALDIPVAAPKRAPVTVADLRNKDSSTIKNADMAQGLTTAGIGSLGLSGLFGDAVEKAGQLQSLGLLDRAMTWASDNALLLIAAALIVAGLIYMQHTKRARVGDHNSGANRGR